MIEIRKAGDRGHAQHGWLDSFHTFSFADYYDPRFMGFRSLRVINEDRVQPGHGFPMHAHRDMEILTYIVEGALEHQDSMGNGSVIRPGDVQRMSAGTGVRHSEFNPSPTEGVHLLQIWLLPAATGIDPSYEQRHYPREARTGSLRLVASPDARDGSLHLHQDADVFATLLPAGATVAHALRPGRAAWLQVVRGDLALNGTELSAGDGAAIENEPALDLSAMSASEAILFDLA